MIPLQSIRTAWKSGAHTGVGIGLAMIAVLTIVPAAVNGRYINRWRMPHELHAAAQSISRFPTSLGAWQAVADLTPLTSDVIHELGIVDYVQRAYKHRDSEQVIAMLVMVGRPGSLVRHPPNICYGNMANTLLGERLTSPISSGSSHIKSTSVFRVLDYRPQSQLRKPFSVGYGFSTGSEWAVPEWPRLAYGSAAVLYKVQIQSTGESVLVDDFLKAFVKGFSEFQQGKPRKNG
jgi:hypothetical protein